MKIIPYVNKIENSSIKGEKINIKKILIGVKNT
jgi:hypothetical protein